MISLRRILVSQTPLPSDIRTKMPDGTVQINESDFFSPQTSLIDRLNISLKSHRLPLVIWALHTFPKLALVEKRSFKMLPYVLQYLSLRNIQFEYAASVCLLALSKSNGKSVAAPILSTIQSRLHETPAIEYIQILKNIIPFLTPETVQSCITPMIIKFFEKTQEYHFAAAELITAFSFKELYISTDVFLKMMTLRVIVDNYLMQMIKIATKSFSEDWCGKIFPSQLLQIANSNPELRYGILRTALSSGDIFQAKAYYSFISAALNWASNSDDVAMVIVSKADEIVTPKTVDLFPKMKALLSNITKSKDPRIRINLPKIISSNPSLFFQNDLELQNVFFSLAKDPHPEIRLAFLNSFLSLFTLSKSQVGREELYSLLLPFFEDPNQQIKERLCNSMIYQSLGTQRLHSLMEHYIQFASSIDQWRLFSEIVKTFLSWSNEIVRGFWSQFAVVVNDASKKWPHAITQSILGFYNRVSMLVDDQSVHELEEVIIKYYAESDNYQMRCLFAKIAGCVCFQTQKFYLVVSLWNKIVELAKTDILCVVANIIPQLIKFRQYFIANGKLSLEKEVTTLYLELGKTEDSYIKDTWEEHWPHYNIVIKVSDYDIKVEQSKSLLISKKDLPGQKKTSIVHSSASETSKISPQSSNSLSLQCQKIRKSRVVFSSQTKGKLFYRKVAGDSKLPSINDHE